MNITIDLTPTEFKKKPFLEKVYLKPFALKLYLLADKSEQLLLAAICNKLATEAKYFSLIQNKEVPFYRENKNLDEILEAVQAFYYNCQELSTNTFERNNRDYWYSLKSTIINNWTYFNPNTRKSILVKFNKYKLRALN